MSVGWLGCTVEIYMRFAKEKHARWAYHVAEDMIKLIYAPEELPWVREADQCASLSEQYLKYRKDIEELDLHPERRIRHLKSDLCALDWLERRRTVLAIDRCADISRCDSFEDAFDFFPQLCFACALRFPQVSFTASHRYEMTVSGSIRCVRAVYDGAVIRVEEISGERPFDEQDWNHAKLSEYAVKDGAFAKELEAQTGL